MPSSAAMRSSSKSIPGRILALMRMRPVPFRFTFEVGFSLGASGILDYYGLLIWESRIICIKFTTAYAAPDVTPEHTMKNTTNPAMTNKPRRKDCDRDR